MKFCILIIDGASGLPLPERSNKTSLELAYTPNLDAMAGESTLGLARTVPTGMVPSSTYACAWILGYDPRIYYLGRAGIEARNMGIIVDEGEAVFRCNLVSVHDGKMRDYSTGHISSEEAQQLIEAVNQGLGNENIHFYPGVSYRNILKLRSHEETLLAHCTPPHDIPHKPVDGFIPTGKGSELLRKLMECSQDILRDHPVNIERIARGEAPATMIWLFWGTGRVPEMPPFKQLYGMDSAMTSGVDLLRGLARMTGMEVLDIQGVTDSIDNDYRAQAAGALEALEEKDLVIIHIEATDEAGHDGAIDDKVEAIQQVDKEVVSRLRTWRPGELRVLIMPDHATPIETRTHTDDLVPFMLCGPGFSSKGTRRFTELEAGKTGLFISEDQNIMKWLLAR